MKGRVWKSRYLPIAIFLLSGMFLNGLVYIAGSTEAAAHLIPLRCPFRMFFHTPCPTCGLVHALIDGFTGQWVSSYRYHPLGVILLVGSGFLSIAYLLNPPSIRIQFRRVGSFLSLHPRILLGAVIVYVLFGVLRYQLSM